MSDTYSIISVSPETVMRFIEKIGRQKIPFSSDIPFGTMKVQGQAMPARRDAPAHKPGLLHRRTKLEFKKILSLPIGDKMKKWMFSKRTDWVGVTFL